MKNPIDHFWRIRLENCKKALEANNFDVFLADGVDQTKQIILEQIIPATGAKSASPGGSLTLKATGILEAIKDLPGVELWETFSVAKSREEVMERCRQALLVDLYLTGTNAVTESGILVNLDMYGNRVGAITFGPKYVVVLVGRNKIVTDVNSAIFRIKDYVAPVNSMRLDKKTPCIKTAECMDCKSEDRICNTWTITEKSFPKGRIKVVLINEEIGF